MGFEEIRGTFIAESADLLLAIEEGLLLLEQAPGDRDAINAVFRAAHTIKGSAGIVGFASVEQFTHVVENVLDRLREGLIPVNEGLIGLLLKCHDHIRSLIERSSIDPEGALEGELKAREDSLLESLRAFLGKGDLKGPLPEHGVGPVKAKTSQGYSGRISNENYHISIRFGQDILRHGMDPLSFINYLGRLGTVVSLTTVFDSMPEEGAFDPEACYIGLEIDFKSDFDKKTIEEVFEFVREGSKIRIIPPMASIEEYIGLINDLEEDSFRLGEILLRGGALTEAELKEALSIQGLAASPDAGGGVFLGDILVKENIVDNKVVEAALTKQNSLRDQRSREAKTIRVDAEKLDSLITLVGELVIAGGSVLEHSQRVNDPELMEAGHALSRLLDDIRDRARTVRMVAIGDTFGRFQRVLRDMSKDLGKEIALCIKGGDTELDKTVVEKIVDPLTHLVRNSADHGIEPSEVRARNGKPPNGTITLNAFHDAGSIVIEVMDDGAGLNRDKILKKAIEKGVARQGQNLTDPEIYSLVFEPGFSTAENVTKLSGRGVGMDVVRRNIEELRGEVRILSEECKGTCVRIRLPLTLAIIDGFLVKVGGALYVIPLDSVLECVELPVSQRDAGGMSYINLRGDVLPYIRLKEVFGEGGGDVDHESIVVVHHAGRKVGLVVQGLFGGVQAVIRSLGKIYRDMDGVSGATILGDGRVALIVDVARLIGSVDEAPA